MKNSYRRANEEAGRDAPRVRTQFGVRHIGEQELGVIRHKRRRHHARNGSNGKREAECQNLTNDVSHSSEAQGQSGTWALGNGCSSNSAIVKALLLTMMCVIRYDH